jgi:creatinine amidohydrolase
MTIMQKVRLADMTAVEAAARLKQKPVIILPFGAQETQGPHAPMGDFQLADRVAEEVARAAGAVMAPTMPFGDSEFLRTAPGCVSLSPATFTKVVEEIVGNFLDHGLDHIVVFNGQTNNAPWIDDALRTIRKTRGVLVPTLHLWRILTPAQLADIYGDKLKGSQGHGGDPITSMFLHYFPEKLRMDLVEPPRPFKRALGLQTRSISSVDFQGVAVPLPFTIDELSNNGNLSGDGRLSSAEIGARSAAAIIAFATAFLKHFATVDPRDPLKGG